MPEVLEPPVKAPAETKDPKFGDFMKALLSNEEAPKEPKNYACVLHNDRTTEAYTVVRALMEGFGLSQQRAVDIMMAVHEGTRGVIAILPEGEAQEKTEKAMAVCHTRGYTDFRITVEEEK